MVEEQSKIVLAQLFLPCLFGDSDTNLNYISLVFVKMWLELSELALIQFFEKILQNSNCIANSGGIWSLDG